MVEVKASATRQTHPSYLFIYLLLTADITLLLGSSGYSDDGRPQSRSKGSSKVRPGPAADTLFRGFFWEVPPDRRSHCAAALIPPLEVIWLNSEWFSSRCQHIQIRHLHGRSGPLPGWLWEKSSPVYFQHIWPQTWSLGLSVCVELQEVSSAESAGL